MVETYHSLEELLIMADRDSVSPGIIACRVEAEESGRSVEAVWSRMKRMLPVFRESIKKGLTDTGKSASGLVGGDASRLYNGSLRFLSPINRKAASYALAIAEANAKMYRIVACPTAGSCGILPAVILAVGEESHCSDDELTRALFTAAGFGKVVAEKASIAGAVGGCQAECGTACAMAAAAGVDLLRGSNEEMANAFALALKNILGLACDPVGGLVEVPCVKRNAFHAVHAMTAVDMAMNGIKSVIPADEVIEAMGDIGRRLPVELKETSRAGLAMTATGKKINAELLKKAHCMKR